METLEGCAISYAVDSIGQKEKKGNQGFVDPIFDAWIRNLTPFKNGHAWCCYFVWSCWKQAVLDFGYSAEIIDEQFSGGTIRTFRHFKSIGWTDQTPKPGSIVIWQNFDDGEPLTTGHAGLIEEVYDDYLITIEGNTNAAGSREGDQVARKNRKIDFKKENGLRMLGFIHFNY